MNTSNTKKAIEFLKKVGVKYMTIDSPILLKLAGADTLNLSDILTAFEITIKDAAISKINTNIQVCKERGDGEVPNSAYWQACGLHDAKTIINNL